MKAKAWVGWLALAIGVAILLAGVAQGSGRGLSRKGLAPTPVVGVVGVSGLIWSFDATEVVDMLRYVEEQEEIAGVVLDVDSFGGDVTPVEEIYLALVRLREKKPVVASVSMALSGGYYVAAPANFIYAKPSAFIGSIGVSWFLPGPERVEEDVATTGPLKATGFSVTEAMDALEVMKESFLQAVIVQRGERLKASKVELSEGKIYSGGQALHNGLIDAIGSRPDAVEKVAQLTGISKYKIVDINHVFFLKWLEEISQRTGTRAQGDLEGVMKAWREVRTAAKPQQPLPRYQLPY